MTEPAIMPTEVSDVDIAFPAHAEELMPPMQAIPFIFGGAGAADMDPADAAPWLQLQFDWFFNRMSDPSFVGQPGINAEHAYRHLSVIQGSYAPKHEFKVAAVSYLASLWFSKVIYTDKLTGKKVEIP